MITRTAVDDAHLNILDNGQPVTVPAHIGLTANSVSSMHTHDQRGVIHIESPTAGRFTLGQFFTEWKQPLSGTCVGTLCASTDKPLRFYLDGQPYTGDPTQIELKAHQEIAIVCGTPPAGDEARLLHNAQNRGPMLSIGYWCGDGCLGHLQLRQHKGHLFTQPAHRRADARR